MSLCSSGVRVVFIVVFFAFVFIFILGVGIGVVTGLRSGWVSDKAELAEKLRAFGRSVSFFACRALRRERAAAFALPVHFADAVRRSTTLAGAFVSGCAAAEGGVARLAAQAAARVGDELPYLSRREDGLEAGAEGGQTVVGRAPECFLAVKELAIWHKVHLTGLG